MIYRIAESEEWLSTLRCGQFASADLAQEGFIHCSEKQQILRTARNITRVKLICGCWKSTTY